MRADELAHQRETFKSLNEELDKTFAELAGF